MITISDLSEKYETLADKDELYSISARDIVRLYRAQQRALNEKAVLELKVASLELEKAYKQPTRIVYG